MFLRENPYIAVLCITAIVSSCVALTAWTRREVAPATRPFTWLMVAIAAYASIAALSAATTWLPLRILWATLEYVASNSIIALYLTFTLYFTGQKQWLTPLRRAAIWSLPCFNMGLTISNHWHHQVWSDIAVSASDPGLILFRHGPGYFWIAACFYIYVLTGSMLVARSALRASRLYRRQAAIVLLSALPPLIAGSLYALALVPPGMNILPMSFSLTGLIYFATLFSFRLFDLLPIARDTLVERMSDGLLVLDNEGRIIDMNPAAKRYASDEIAGLPYVGRPIEQVLSQWPDIVRYCHAEDDLTIATIDRLPRQTDARASTHNSASAASTHPHPTEEFLFPSHFEVRVTRLRNYQKKATGRLLVLRDITQQYRDRIRLQQVNTELRRQLEEVQILRDRLTEQAIRDGLTGLFNRRYFEETLPAELAKAERSGSSLSVVLLDIDHFKQVNDTYGHLAGDRALRSFSDLLHQHIRTSDIACRYGGEEFIVAMPDMPLQEAYQRAENIRRSLEEAPIQFEEQTFKVTVSIGLGAFPDFKGSQHQLLQRIDQALYTAKANGRNRVEIASEKTAIASKLGQLEAAIATSKAAASKGE